MIAKISLAVVKNMIKLGMKKKIRIMPCLDMRNGRVVKGVQFVDIKDAGDPVGISIAYCEAGADEIALLDINATLEGRATTLDVVRRVADAVSVPFTVGGGVTDCRSAEAVLRAGADRISTSSAAFRNPSVIKEMIQEFGQNRITVAIDAAVNDLLPSGYEVFIDGGRTATGTDVIEWAKQISDFGATTILPTSKSNDGVRTGYDLPLIQKICAVTDADVVASGGAGTLEHFYEAASAGATVLLAASVFHFGIIRIPDLKAYLGEQGFSVSY